MSESETDKIILRQPDGVSVPSNIVVRSDVPDRKRYQDYKDDLRWDFFYSCAYCNVMEFEGQGLGFSIDHYKPQSSHQSIKSTYSNLMWSCDDCNSRKGDKEVPQEAADAGFRYFKADEDEFYDHFVCSDTTISGITKVGHFTDTMLYLNRQKLQRIRALRRDADIAAAAIVSGINGLRRLPIDQLPQRVKGEALVKSKRALEAAGNMQERVDSLLRDFAHSPLVDRSVDDLAAQKGRRDLQEQLGAMFPGRYKGRDKKANKSS